MRIADRQLNPITQRIAATPNKLVDDKIVLELLAAVADKSGRSSTQSLDAMSAAGELGHMVFSVAIAAIGIWLRPAPSTDH